MAAKKKPKIKIKKSEEGSLRRIAQRDGGMKKNGEISRSWMRKKMSDPKTKPSTKKKINFALNFGKGK